MAIKRVRVRLVALAACGALAVGGLGSAAAVSRPAPGPHWVAVQAAHHADQQPFRSQLLRDRYLITFNPGTSNDEVGTALRHAEAAGGEAYYRYSRAVKGFAASLTPEALRRLHTDPSVASIEPDATISVAASEPNPPSWGLDRIDQHALPLDNDYTYAETGKGVTAYIIDTGIRSTHQDLVGRVLPGYDIVDDGYGTEDCNGHGTHVSGTVGGTTYGVAKQVNLVPVRVLDCDGTGTISGVVKGVDWVTAHHAGLSVANMSLGGVTSDTLDAAVANSIAHGVNYVVAAGNDDDEACSYSPGRVPDVITVGATGRTDSRAEFSNYGQCVDLWAPGEDIVSDWGTGDSDISTLSGTSMASPHVAGVVAQYLQANPDATPARVQAAIVGATSSNVLSGLNDGSPNRMLFSLLPALLSGHGPTINPPLMVLGPATATAGAAAPVRVLLGAGTNPAEAIKSYELQRSDDGGRTWQDVPLPQPLARSVVTTAATRTVVLRARAIDPAGHAGPWATGPSAQFTLSDHTVGTAYAPTARWWNVSVPDAQNGKLEMSGDDGATATFTFTGTQFAWIADASSSRGQAAVLIDGVQRAVVDLYSLTPGAQRVAYLGTGLAPGPHTVTIKVLHRKNTASSGYLVGVDGWATAG
ncbi:MAG TPA: S8 family peptidase [Sporichthyaceae bacterium]|nr:S8 family peptidase [Sporichthyaceae bacterium]